MGNLQLKVKFNEGNIEAEQPMSAGIPNKPRKKPSAQMSSASLSKLSGKAKRDYIEKLASEKPAWGKHKIKERDEIEASERIKAKRALELASKPYDLDKDSLALNILERKVLRTEGAQNY